MNISIHEDFGCTSECRRVGCPDDREEAYMPTNQIEDMADVTEELNLEWRQREEGDATSNNT